MALTYSVNHCYAQFDAVYDAGELDGINGLAVNGINPSEAAGVGVSNAGDFNGDGIDDFIVGADFAITGVNGVTGASYIVFGDESGFPASFNLSDINGTNGLTIFGASDGDRAGIDVSHAGDFNGDGIDDIIIGASGAGAKNNEAGSSYIVFGSQQTLSNPLSLSDINVSNGVVINGINTFDSVGRSVSFAGDFNGDGIDDVIIGALGSDPSGNSYAGSTYVIFGHINGFDSPINLSDIDGENGLVFEGVNEADRSGISVSYAGDVNGDGLDDVIIGARGADPVNTSYAGSSYVVFGGDDLPSPMSLSSLNGTNGFTINGVNQSDFVGDSVSFAGDFNHDGIDDVMVGVRGSDPNGVSNAGSVYVVFGRQTIFPSTIDLDEVNGTIGFVIQGIQSQGQLGYSVSEAGDVNGDGIDDIILGASNADSGGEFNTGISYVVFGSESGLPDSIEVSSLNGDNGFSVLGAGANEFSGDPVSTAGDVNSDGIDDVIIGARAASSNGNFASGRGYVIYGIEKPLFEDGFD